MNDWLVGIFGEAYATAAFWTIILLAVAIVLLVFLRANRRFTSGTFISGGRNRQPRLGVTDATPVDNHRRLVLVRRDNVEHLILIGGPSDVVIESDIPIPARDLEETVTTAETVPIVGETVERVAHDLSTQADAPRLDPVSEPRSPQPAAPAAPRPERRSAPAAHGFRTVSRSTVPPAQAPTRYPVNDRREPVQSSQPVRAPDIEAPSEATQSAAASARPVAPTTPAGTSATPVAENRPTAVSEPSLMAEHNSTQLENTLEDEMSRLLEEMSEQKH
ncbi:hypothetical protein AB2N04_11405 [Nitratireductor sp. GISD-1A_MAKvit]|uniref:hypothetical protein n=1 Tax=Nitratireductor sp. GISD-1A_MAKvit TaxID=3234198 RepID=UPI003466C60A